MLILLILIPILAAAAIFLGAPSRLTATAASWLNLLIAGATRHQDAPRKHLAPNGALADDLIIWSDGPYAYADYVFRGASKGAKLVEPPVGYRDI